VPIATYRNAFLIYNPSAGALDRSGVERIDLALGVLCRSGHRISAVETKGPGTAVDIARQCVSEGADLILAAGGDGTVNEVAKGWSAPPFPLVCCRRAQQHAGLRTGHVGPHGGDRPRGFRLDPTTDLRRIAGGVRGACGAIF
jgi:hypothetical protein